ncbi:MAG TPA: biotin--[acetyl-CoA-carboxylase] ligase [Sedimentisphaerales bacterium]|nr:biotin--[acetyl-CoA-carboxylase] ligase [Sedimentisphaerales bacterium]
MVFRQTGSTNDIAWQYAADPEKRGLAVFAETQTAGRGRTGQKWNGGDSKSVLCSVLLPQMCISAETLTLAAGVAVAHTVGKCGQYEARVKWPNDITLGARKVAGILTEARTIEREAVYVVGIGINCSQSRKDFGEELTDTATSIDIETGSTCSRNDVARRLLVALDDWLAKAAEDPNSVTNAWLELCCQLHRRISLNCSGRTYTGTCIGVDPQKGLVVQLERGGIRMFDALHTHTVRLA